MVMMNQPADIMELLFGEGDFLTISGEVNPPMSGLGEQRLGDTVPEGALQPPAAQLAEQRLEATDFPHSDDQYITLMPDMDMLLESGDDCPKAEGEVIIELLPEGQSPAPVSPGAPCSSVLLQHDESSIFTFPPLPQLAQPGHADDDCLLAQLTDTPSSYSSTLPPSPFSPESPVSPDSARGWDSGYGPIRRSVKEDLKARINIKRHQQGKGELKVEFTPPQPEQLTEEEHARRLDKREKNKMAAQKCREKKRQKADTLEAEIRVLEERQRRHEQAVQTLQEERDHLSDIIAVHAAVCPHLPQPQQTRTTAAHHPPRHHTSTWTDTCNAVS